jgi:protein-tyrosine sulfotransferase
MPHSLHGADLLGQIHRSPLLDPIEPCPVFIIGCRRSGTTLLAWLLDSHSEICAIPENYLSRSLLQNTFEGTKTRNFLPHLVEHLGEDPRRFLQRLAVLISGIYSDYAKRQSKRRWVAKELFLADSLDVLDACFDYQARYIFIARHGFDVAHSITERFGYRGIDFHLSGFALMNALLEWTATNEKIRQFAERTGERTLFIKYEEFVARPLDISQAVFSFLLESWDPSILERMWVEHHDERLGLNSAEIMGAGFDNSRRQRWESWPPTIIRQLAQIANPMLTQLGYAEL